MDRGGGGGHTDRELVGVGGRTYSLLWSKSKIEVEENRGEAASEERGRER